MILVIEDNLADEALILRALRKAEVKQGILVVPDGTAAVNYLLEALKNDRNSECKLPALIFLDYELPTLNGLQLLEWIRSYPHTSTVPVVFMTSAGGEGLAKKSSALGAKAFVYKSLNFREFSTAIQVHVEHFVGWMQQGCRKSRAMPQESPQLPVALAHS